MSTLSGVEGIEEMLTGGRLPRRDTLPHRRPPRRGAPLPSPDAPIVALAHRLLSAFAVSFRGNQSPTSRCFPALLWPLRHAALPALPPSTCRRRSSAEFAHLDGQPNFDTAPAGRDVRSCRGSRARPEIALQISRAKPSPTGKQGLGQSPRPCRQRIPAPAEMTSCYWKMRLESV